MEVQCSKIPGIFSDVSSQTNPIFSIVLGFYMEYFEMRAFLIFHEYIQKIILFEISPLKTKNNTKKCIKLGTNIINEASKEWTLRLNPQKAEI